MKKKIFAVISLLLFLSSILGISGKAAAAAPPIIYIGDSRGEGLDQALKASDKQKVIFYHETSQGYSWFSDQVAAKVTTQLYKYPATRFRIVINLGINDHLGSIGQYAKKYYQLAKNDWKGYDIYIVSITPVDEAKMAENTLYPQTNDQILASNQVLQKKINRARTACPNLHYVDIFSTMRNGKTLASGYETGYDGAHYTPATYQKIWKLLLNEVH